MARKRGTDRRSGGGRRKPAEPTVELRLRVPRALFDAAGTRAATEGRSVGELLREMIATNLLGAGKAAASTGTSRPPGRRPHVTEGRQNLEAIVITRATEYARGVFSTTGLKLGALDTDAADRILQAFVSAWRAGFLAGREE